MKCGSWNGRCEDECTVMELGCNNTTEIKLIQDCVKEQAFLLVVMNSSGSACSVLNVTVMNKETEIMWSGR
jgi:hypothetical protein